MDRLLCGDVGFGKTEVALRAAFKCVMGGKQCAMLAAHHHPGLAALHTAIAPHGGIPRAHRAALPLSQRQGSRKRRCAGLKDGDSGHRYRHPPAAVTTM